MSASAAKEIHTASGKNGWKAAIKLHESLAQQIGASSVERRRKGLPVMSPDELAYYRERAFIEKRRASEAKKRAAADIHLKMACIYEKLIELEECEAPTLRIVRIGHPSDPDAGALLPSAPLLS